MLTLSPDDTGRLERAQAALLGSMSHRTLDGWLSAVASAVGDLFRADGAVSLFPARGKPVAAGSAAAVLGGVRTLEPGAIRWTDPVFDAGMGRRRTLDLSAWVAPALWGDGVLESSDLHRDVLIPAGMRHLLGLTVGLPLGEALVLVGHDRPEPPFGDAGTRALLGTLVPPFRAGVQTLMQFAALRQTLAAKLDTLEEPLMVFDGHGAPLHGNAPVQRLLADEPEADRLRAALADLAGALARPVRPPEEIQLREVQTATGRYSLRGSRLEPGLICYELFVVVSVERLSPGLQPVDALIERYRLTRREAEVAHLLATGHTNDGIAGRLDMSPHTARRHTEKILAKLDLHSRAAIASKIFG